MLIRWATIFYIAVHYCTAAWDCPGGYAGPQECSIGICNLSKLTPGSGPGCATTRATTVNSVEWLAYTNCTRSGSKAMCCECWRLLATSATNEPRPPHDVGPRHAEHALRLGGLISLACAGGCIVAYILLHATSKAQSACPKDDAPLPLGIVFNQPGHWNFFVSHCQQETREFALDLFFTMKEHRKTVWLDVKMGKRDEAAMEEGVRGCDAVIVLLSKSYFARPFCVKELEWSMKYKKPVIPCVPVELKPYIAELLGRSGAPPPNASEPTCAAAPEHLRCLGSINIEELNRSDIEYWRMGVNKILKAERKLLVLEP